MGETYSCLIAPGKNFKIFRKNSEYFIFFGLPKKFKDGNARTAEGTGVYVEEVPGLSIERISE
jgi:hypothetical protein